jgi:2'-5' RNA ligase
MAEESLRAFIAVDIDSDEVMRRLVSGQDHLRQTGADLKLVAPENIHITMRFLGEVRGSQLDNVKQVLDDCKFNAFDCAFTGMGAFPNLNRINVVWVGIAEGATDLERIATQIEAGLRGIGFPPERKGFNAHVTLARAKTGRNRDALSAYIEQMRDYDFGKIRVNEVRLKQSILKPTGPVYRTIHGKKATEG